MAQRTFAPNIRPTKNPPVRPYFKNKKLQKKNCCSFSARKHPTPPGTGTEPDASSGLGAAPAPGARQFSQALLAVGPPVRTDPREKKPGMPQVRTGPRFCKSQFFGVEYPFSGEICMMMRERERGEEREGGRVRARVFRVWLRLVLGDGRRTRHGTYQRKPRFCVD